MYQASQWRLAHSPRGLRRMALRRSRTRSPEMRTTYDVSVWSIEAYKGTRATTYYVLWKVAGRRWKQSFKVKALAESFRAELMAASRRGEAFDVDTGRPVSVQRQSRDCSWYEHACAFADMKWPRVAATTRRTHAEALTAITCGLLTTEQRRSRREAATPGAWQVGVQHGSACRRQVPAGGNEDAEVGRAAYAPGVRVGPARHHACRPRWADRSTGR